MVGMRTEEREKPENVKERIVIDRNFENIRLKSEKIAGFAYRPVKCKKTYRMVGVRKNVSVEKGDAALFSDIRYFFYVTTRLDLSAAQVVEHANNRCNQESLRINQNPCAGSQKNTDRSRHYSAHMENSRR